MDSDDKGTRLRAEAVFVRNGKNRALVEVDGPAPKKKSAKKAAYKTKDTIAESRVDEAATD